MTRLPDFLTETRNALDVPKDGMCRSCRKKYEEDYLFRAFMDDLLIVCDHPRGSS